MSKSKFVKEHNGVRYTRQDEAFSRFLLAEDGETKFEALREGIFLTWPAEFCKRMEVGEDGGLEVEVTDKWNPWLERHLRAFTNTEHSVRHGETVFRYIGLTGCGGAGKTHAAGLYAVAWWGCSPHDSIAILTSTTVGMIRHRIWPVISHYAGTAGDCVSGKRVNLGHMVESQLELRASKGDAKHAIFALAVAHGETQKAIHNLKGMHAQRILLIIDEANGTPEAIFETLPNLMKGALDVTVIIIGNPFGRLDPHGRAITPEEGWGVFGEHMLEWKSRAVPEWQLESGLVLRFDGKESPNVKAGLNLHPYIYTIDNWRKDNQPGMVGTFGYWTQCRGMHPPEGFASTVFTEQLFIRCAHDELVTFTSERVKMAFLDPAFGGDACILRFAEMGDALGAGGKKVVQFGDWMEITFDPNAAAHDLDYQIARQVLEKCKARGVAPHCFGLDATGTGRGVGAILAAEWSPGIQYMNWGGGATDRPSAQNDGRPGKEVYANFVTELWFATREALESGQVRGFSRESVAQFCSRQFEMQGKKYKLERKDEMKARMRRSPDHADADVGLIEVARRNGLTIEGKVSETKDYSWARAARAAQEDGELDLDGMVAVGEGGGWAMEEAF